MFMQLQVDFFFLKKKIDKCIEKILHKLREEGNQAYAVDYNNDGSKFATGGKDCKVTQNPYPSNSISFTKFL